MLVPSPLTSFSSLTVLLAGVEAFTLLVYKPPPAFSLTSVKSVHLGDELDRGEFIFENLLAHCLDAKLKLSDSCDQG